MYGMMSLSLIPHSMSFIFHPVCLERLLPMFLLPPGNKVVISNCTFYNWGSNKDGKTLIGLLEISPN